MDLLNMLSFSKFVSGQSIARKLNISRSAVHKRINKLRVAGYEITGGENLGYSLLKMPDRILPEEIKSYFPEKKSYLNKIVYFDKTDSTQIIAKEMAVRDNNDWSIIIADQQAAAFGRLRKKWFSPTGGLWFSLILMPPLLPDNAPQLTLVISLSICKTLRKYLNTDVFIKWPNDILIGGRKLCGILTEMSAEVGKLNWVVLGIGLNVNNELVPDLQKDAVSMSEIAGRKFNRTELLADIIKDFKVYYDKFCKKGFASFEKEYSKNSYLCGKIVRVDKGGESISEGMFDKIDKNGYMWLRSTDGSKEKIIVGNVRVIKDFKKSQIK